MSDQQDRIEKLEYELERMKEALALMRQISAVQDRRIRLLEDLTSKTARVVLTTAEDQ